MLNKGKWNTFGILLILGVIYSKNSFAVDARWLPTDAFETISIIVPSEKETMKSEVFLDNLVVPWEIRFLPDGTVLVTERTGYLTIFREDTRERINVPNVAPIGEGGLLGLAIHPKFKTNQWLYLYRTTQKNEQYTNQVVRYKFVNNTLTKEKIILDNLPANYIHNGGRISFGPDGYLYITTGDAGTPESAQAKDVFAGKILRVDEEGWIPSTNPFSNPIYSLGHRNPQGIAWDKKGRLWETEHGPIGFDKFNLIELGKNYGWPVVQGYQIVPGMVKPVLSSGINETWAPAGLAYWNGKLYFAGLRGQTLYEVEADPTSKKIKKHFFSKFGRIRAVVVGPDNALYISTSNLDGRGVPRSNDDKIIRITTDKISME